MVSALPGQACQAVQSAPKPGQRRAPLRSRWRLYSLFLDADKQYSAPISKRLTRRWTTPSLPRSAISPPSCDPARRPRARHRSRWGGLGLYLAEMTGANLTGVTLSTKQLQVSNARAAEKNLTRWRSFSSRTIATFRPVRAHRVGGHVRTCRRRFLRDYFGGAPASHRDGVMVLHSIGRSEGPESPTLITKYIFPGGYIPALSEVTRAIERAGSGVRHRNLRLHYAETLKAWRERFMARRGEAVRLYDERFARMWEFYLACSEMAFRKQNMMNFQIQLTKRQGVVPITGTRRRRRSRTSGDRARQAAAAADRGRIGRRDSRD